MTALSIQPTYPIFTDVDGQPLDSGYVYIGQANLDPQGNPINVYWDIALTQLAAQPIRTLNGYPSNSGTPARLYVGSDYSIRVMNKKASTVYSAPTATERFSAVVVGGIDSSEVAYAPAGTGAVATTVQEALRRTVSVKDFGAKGDWNGTTGTDDTAAIQAAIASFGTNSGELYFPPGRYKTTSKITVAAPIRIRGAGRGSNGGVHKTEIVKTGSYTAIEFVAGAAWGGISDISIGSSNASYTGDGLYVSSGRIDCERLSITNHGGMGLNIYDANCSNFADIYIYNCTIGLYISGNTPPDTNGMTLVNFDILSSRQDGIYVANAIANCFVGMSIQGSARYGIFINSDRNLFYGTYSENNAGGALSFGSSADHNFVDFTVAEDIGTPANSTKTNGWRRTGDHTTLPAGIGIKIPSVSPKSGMTSQTLSYYEEGTWTPTQGGGVTVVGTFSSSGRYLRIGNLVTISGRIQGSTSVALADGAVLTNSVPWSALASGTGLAVDSTTTKKGALILYSGSFNLYAVEAISASPYIDFALTYMVS